MKKTVIIFSNGKGIEFDGWIKDSKMNDIANQHCFEGYGTVRDYVHGYSGERISHPIHGKYSKGKII